MIELIKGLYKKYFEIISYLFFGVCTTLISYIIYILFFNAFHFPNVTSDIFSWIFGVAFAFFTNRKYVFINKEEKNIFREASEFFLCRAGTGALDVILMYITVDILKYNGNIMKIIVSIIVVILNYIGSKIWIFTDKKDGKH